MKEKLVKIIIATVIIVINSCEYDPTGSYERITNTDIEPPEIENIDLTFDQDTIYLYTERPLSFNFISSNQEITSIKFLIDNEVFDTCASDSGHFSMRYYYLAEGIHTVSLELYTRSGTGSIADFMDVEQLVTVKTWVLIVDKSYPYPATSAIQNGLLKISWNKYLASDFKEYIVNKILNNSTIIYELDRVIVTEFIDSSYIGEGCYFQVFVNTTSDEIIEWSYLELENEL